MVEQPKSKLIDTEDAATGAVGIGVYVRYFKSIGITMGVAAVLSNALTQAASVYSGSNEMLYGSVNGNANLSIKSFHIRSLANSLVDRPESFGSRRLPMA